jgi:hypothetical protein
VSQLSKTDEKTPRTHYEIAHVPATDIRRMTMTIDEDRIDDAVLALLYLGLHDQWRTWKGFDWDAMSRLYEKGFISDPVSKANSVVFTEEGLRRSSAGRQRARGKSPSQ